MSNEEFEKISAQFYNNFNEYLINYFIPEVIAFYLANRYYRSILSDGSLKNHMNSVKSILNISYNIDELIPEIKKILKIKYGLKITKINPLCFEKIY